MNRKETELDYLMDVLQEKVVIPQVVQERAQEAFAAIRSEVESAGGGGQNERVNNGQSRGRYRKNSRRKFTVALIAAVLAIGTISVGAAYLRRSKSLTEGMRISETQQIQLQEKQMTTLVGQSATDQGITVTVLESITDQYFTHIAFRVEGCQMKEGVQPDFGSVKVTVGGRDDFNYSGSFYNGIVSGSDGKPEHADGSPVQTDAEGRLIQNYTMDDGSLEFRMTLFNTREKGFFINKPVHVELEQLGTVEKAAFQPEAEGRWSFDWTLKGSPEIKQCHLNAPLGDSGATVTNVELSPVSLTAEYEFSRRSEQEIYQDENGQEKVGEFLIDPPQLTGVRMKDGTLYPYINGGPGSSGYESKESSVYRLVFATGRVLDVEQVESLLFRKPDAGGAGQSVEDQFYIVPVDPGAG